MSFSWGFFGPSLESPSHNVTLVWYLFGLCLLWCFFLTRSTRSHDEREPPLAPQSFPFIGHVLGHALHTFNYPVQLSQKMKLPIFSMQLPGQKIYVVSKPNLIQAVQRQYKSLAFAPVAAKFASRVGGVSSTTAAILEDNVNGDEGEWGLSILSHIAIRASLKPGPYLDQMNQIMIKSVSSSLDAIQPASGTKRTQELYGWLRDLVTTATTKSVYGPSNPYDDKTIADQFWAFESGFMPLMLGMLPSLTARKAIRARDQIAAAFVEYFKAGGVESASGLAKNRFQAQVDHGVPIQDIARYEVIASIPVLVNTAPAVFWMLLHLFSDSELLEQVREEIDDTMETTVDGDIYVRRIDISALKVQCPLLLSMYQEVLRFHSIGTSVREVREDTFLNKQWLLKKGSLVQIPARAVHQDADLWGSDAVRFNPQRFLKDESKPRIRDSYFQAFGGGKTLCPGRHFATNEILAVVAVFVARLDMKPVVGDWSFPTFEKTNAASVVMEPDHDIKVEISTRPGFDRSRWELGLKVSGQIFAMVTEDLGEQSW